MQRKVNKKVAKELNKIYASIKPNQRERDSELAGKLKKSIDTVAFSKLRNELTDRYGEQLNVTKKVDEAKILQMEAEDLKKYIDDVASTISRDQIDQKIGKSMNLGMVEASAKPGTRSKKHQKFISENEVKDATVNDYVKGVVGWVADIFDKTS